MTNDKSQPLRLIEIDEGANNQRIDNFLIRLLKGLPKSRIYRIIRKGEVRVNSKRVKASQKLNVGDLVRVPPIMHLPDRDTAIGNFKNIEETILYQDNLIMVLNKPAGMAVHGGSGVSVGVIESLREAIPHGEGLELIHRLDKATSGCLMVAKKRSYLRLAQDALRHRGQIQKSYFAVVHGRWPRNMRQIDAPLLTKSPSGKERVTIIDERGKESLTRFECIAANESLSLIKASPVTGRTHQIRVHARWARHPIVGDDRYGDKTLDQHVCGQGNKPRLMLHACQLVIPALGEQPGLDISAPLEISMKQFILENFGELAGIEL